MKLSNENLLLASLLGSKATRQINNLQEIQKVLIDSNLPTVPAIQVDRMGNLWESDKPLPSSKQFFPFTFKNVKGEDFLLPFEPLLSIDAKNEIEKSNVAKLNRKVKDKDGIETDTNWQGTVKQRWSRGDYNIRMTGVLIGPKLIGADHITFPKDDFSRLNTILCERQKWQITCEPLQLLDIHYVVVESFSFPFTKGENVQAYEIIMSSDFDFSLELTEEDIKQ